jgi:hypothetical protein
LGSAERQIKIKGEKKMKKVVYSVQKLGRLENPKITGLGYLTDEDLVIACISQKGKPYIRVFEGVREYCHPQYGRDGEFKGEYTEYREIEVEKESNGYTSLEKIDIEVTYKIWFKYAD